jgi:hypothetical protein
VLKLRDDSRLTRERNNAQRLTRATLTLIPLMGIVFERVEHRLILFKEPNIFFFATRGLKKLQMLNTNTNCSSKDYKLDSLILLSVLMNLNFEGSICVDIILLHEPRSPAGAEEMVQSPNAARKYRLLNLNLSVIKYQILIAWYLI